MRTNYYFLKVMMSTAMMVSMVSGATMAEEAEGEAVAADVQEAQGGLQEGTEGAAAVGQLPMAASPSDALPADLLGSGEEMTAEYSNPEGQPMPAEAPELKREEPSELKGEEPPVEGFWVNEEGETSRELKEASRESKEVFRESKGASRESKEASRESKEASWEPEEASRESEEASRESKETSQESEKAPAKLVKGPGSVADEAMSEAESGMAGNTDHGEAAKVPKAYGPHRVGPGQEEEASEEETEAAPAPAPAYTDEDLYVLAHAICGEGQGYPDEEQLYIGSVILNRRAHGAYPDSIREVVFQRGQYACTWDGNYYREPTEANWRNAKWLLENGSILPDNVVYQAGFRQGSGMYLQTRYHKYCYR